MNKVLIAAGGSGGHIFPAIALGRSLKRLNKDLQIMYVGSDKALDKRMFEKEGARFTTLSANKLPYKISFGIIIVSFRLLADIFRAFYIMFSFRPDVAVGFGGYVSFPVIFSARILRIRTMVHEQNVLPGRANKILFRLADKIALSFKDTEKTLGRDPEKAVFTGNPVRSEISASDRKSGNKLLALESGRFTILVIGGSQGAAFLNRTFVSSLSAIDPQARGAIQVIHITGVKDYEWALKAYKELRIDHRVHSFIDRIEEAYGAADLIVTRSGASAIFELALMRKPMVLIPYQYALSHQLDNARVFERNGAAVVVEEKDLNSVMFSALILDLMKDHDRIKSLSESAGRMAVPLAADNLAKEVVNLIGK